MFQENFTLFLFTLRYLFNLKFNFVSAQVGLILSDRNMNNRERSGNQILFIYRKKII